MGIQTVTKMGKLMDLNWDYMKNLLMEKD